MTLIFDTGVLIQYFADNPSATIHVNRVLRGQEEGLTTHLVLTELYYKTNEKHGVETARIRFAAVANSKIKVIATNDSLAMEAAQLKSRNSFLSLSDAYIAALTKEYRGTLLTTDVALERVKELRTSHIKF